MSARERAAGRRYAEEQVTGDYFREWIWEQLDEASQMDPDDVIPLETKSDARKVARNMLQQLEWDTRRNLNESADFFKGMSGYLREATTVEWLADEVLYRWREIRGTADRGRHSWKPGVGEARASRIVADFNTLNDLIGHAADQLGATHTSGEGAHTKIYFPRGGQYPYEEARVWRKGGYWHAEGPHARVGVTSLPANALPIAQARGERRAAEASKRKRSPERDAIETLDRMHDYAKQLAHSRGISYHDAVLRMITQPEIHAKALGVSPAFVKMWAEKDREQDRRLGILRSRRRAPGLSER